MKSLVLKAACVGLMCASFSSFAEKVVITGEPVILDKRGDVYYVPSTVTASTTTYHYVTVDGTNRVCYADPQPQLASLGLMAIQVNVGGTTATWNCYEYNTEYFTVTP
ncbi:Uncharacterised protein (plasmid) [Legionella adelaidensis]|uniref:Secreted protein n=1 Tax=Legionella adelaidensis TaxID=45056 RepID=A0A0W0R1B4_9GAMM|nr:hypothetical protein [Legionella adelaidensis]KTC64881.1 hypothetical protein Lade_2175 [Legionella adelaidensis]VEH82948.1 Uncharacterised protein [Legionella adelaidensis]